MSVQGLTGIGQQELIKLYSLYSHASQDDTNLEEALTQAGVKTRNRNDILTAAKNGTLGKEFLIKTTGYDPSNPEHAGKITAILAAYQLDQAEAGNGADGAEGVSVPAKILDAGISEKLHIDVSNLGIDACNNLRIIAGDDELSRKFAALNDTDRNALLNYLSVRRSEGEIKTKLQVGDQSGNVSSIPSRHGDVLNILYTNSDVKVSKEFQEVSVTSDTEQKKLLGEIYTIAHRTPLDKQVLIQKLETLAQKFLWSPQMVADFKSQLGKMPAADIAAIFNNNNFDNATVFNNTFNQLFDIAAISIEEHSDDTAYILTRLQWFSSPPEKLLKASLDEIALLCSKLPNLRDNPDRLNSFLTSLANLSRNVLDGYYSGNNRDLINDYAAFLREPESILLLAETLATGEFGADIGPAVVQEHMDNLINANPPLQAQKIRSIIENVSDGNGGTAKYTLLKDGMIEECLRNPGNTDHVFGRTKTPPDALHPAPDTEFVRTVTGYEKEYDTLVKSRTIKLTGEQARYQQENSNRVADNREQAADYYDQHSDEYPGLGDALRDGAAVARGLAGTLGIVISRSVQSPSGLNANGLSAAATPYIASGGGGAYRYIWWHGHGVRRAA